MFGAVGCVSSLGGLDQADTSVGSSSCVNSGMSLKSSDKMSTAESMPLKHGDDFEETVSVNPSSTSQNLFTALRFLLQALKTVPVLTYISFAMSLLFLVLYLNPFNGLFASSKASSVANAKAKSAHLKTQQRALQASRQTANTAAGAGSSEVTKQG